MWEGDFSVRKTALVFVCQYYTPLKGNFSVVNVSNNVDW